MSDQVLQEPPTGDQPVLELRDLRVEFRTRGGRVQAVHDLSLAVRRGETLGLVGESGCGKSTAGRAVMGLAPVTSGQVLVEGRDVAALPPAQRRDVRRRIQMIFQDPISSLNPRRRIVDVVAEPLRIRGEAGKAESRERARSMLDAVGIDPERSGQRRPLEFSGGQCQRISIARALMSDPDVLICDEPVSALDVSVQAQIINLIADLKSERSLTLVFIAHDLAVVKNVSDRIAVMYLGTIVELAPADELFAAPAHHYTVALQSAIPSIEPDAPARTVLEGELPSPLDPPSGCRFRTRCPAATERCAAEAPALREVAPGHTVACHFPVARPSTR